MERKSAATIKKQQKELGESVNWDFERFTLSPAFSRLVNLAFLRLYNENLIYRAERMVNWCPINQTAISNIEVEYKEVKGKLYYIYYKIVGQDVSIVVATTRPETLLGDEALIVSPDDERYKHLVGLKAIIPLINKEIPILEDSYVDSTFGTGVVKVTPAHDVNDFEIGKRHNLPFTLVIDYKGKNE